MSGSFTEYASLTGTPAPTYPFYFLEHPVLEIKVLKNSFNHHVALFETLVIELPDQVAEDGVPLE